MNTQRRLVLLALVQCLALGAAPSFAQDAPADAPEASEGAKSTPDEAWSDETPDVVSEDGAPSDEEDEVDEYEVGSDDEDVDEVDDADEDDVDEYGVTTRLMTREKLAKIGGAAHRIDEEELEQLAYDDPHDVAASVPGVFVRGEDGFGLRPNIGIRGANSDRSKKVTLMEDGVLFGPAPYSAPAAYYFPIASRMVGVEVFKGPGAIQYGPNTIGGAVNLVTRDVPYTFSGELDANLGSYMTGQAHGWVGASNENLGVLFEGVHWQSDGFKELDGGGDTGFDRQEFMLKTRMNTDLSESTYHQLDLKIGYSREHSNETYLGLTDDDFRDTPFRRYAASELDNMTWDRLQLQAEWTFDLSESLSFKTTAYRNVFDRVWLRVNGFGGDVQLFDALNDPTGANAVYVDILKGEQDSTVPGEYVGLISNARSYVSQGVQTNATWKLQSDSWANRLEAGVRFHNDLVQREHTQYTYRMESAHLVESGEEASVATLNEGSSVALAAYVADQFSFWKLTLAPGLRMEHIQTKLEDELAGTSVEGSQFVLIPGFGAHYEIIENFGALAGVHRGFSPLSPGQSDDVDPETSINYEAGLRYVDPDGANLLEVVGFFNDYNNLLGECTFSSGCSLETLDEQFNGGEVNVYGVEALASWEFALPGAWKLPARIAYTLTLSEFQTAFSSENPQYGDVVVGDALPYIPEHRGSLRLGITNDVFTFNTQVTYTGEMREEAGQGDEGLFTDDQLMVDALASYVIGWGLTGYVKGQNLTFAEPLASRRPFGARPSKPTSVQVGVKYGF